MSHDEGAGFIKNGKWSLPGFAVARDYLSRRGYLCGWVDKVVDRDSFGAIFRKLGKPWYLSECPYYEGFWLDGGIGSVQCSRVPFLLPGLHQPNTCEKHPEQCPFRKD